MWSVLLAAALCVTAAQAGGWWVPQSISTAPEAVQRERYMLLADATTLSYVATHGSYYEAWRANATITGFRRVFDLEANPKAGMRALVFADDAQRRVLIAYRGTDTDILGESGQADVCADALLWGHHPYAALDKAYPFCHRYSQATLNYSAAAQRVARRVAAAFPAYGIMYTGHSLGAGLAMLMTAGRGTCTPAAAAGAVVFSSPQMVVTALQTTPADIAAAAVSSFVVAADPFDPVFVRATAGRYGGLLGSVCRFPPQVPAPKACVECERVPLNISTAVPGCAECFMSHHIFGHYLKLLRAGQLPTCAPPQNGCTNDPLCRGHGKCGTD